MKNFIILSLYCFFLLFGQDTNMSRSVLSSGLVHSESDQTKLVGTIGQVFLVILKTSPTFVGFFVYEMIGILFEG